MGLPNPGSSFSASRSVPTTHFMHACAAENDAAVRKRFEDDPWTPAMLEIENIEPWTILLDAHEPPVSE
jgi:hypothetical protein